MNQAFQKTTTYVIFAALFSSCVTVPYRPQAREVKKLPGKGGIVALKSNHREEDRAFAEQKMENNCKGSSVVIVEESEVSVGTKTDTVAEESKGRKKNNLLSVAGLSFVSSQPSKETETSSVVTNVNEWQIKYRCK